MDARPRAQTPDSYDSFFGFQRPPFSLTPDPRFVYPSASHRAAMEQVTYGLERREPILVVTGDIGTGKTLLCRTVLERLDRKTFVSIVNDPLLDRDDLLKQMLLDFGILSNDRARWAPTSRHELMHALQDFLASLPALRAHAAVVIDEAQHLRPDVLEDIRLLSNVHDERGTMLQILLLGQDNLRELLARPELRQLQQRVSRLVRLEPLSADEVEAYINHRIAVAREGDAASAFPGAKQLRRELAAWESSQTGATFTPAAARAVAQWSRGIPRVVNLVCDRALEAAYATRSPAVDEPHVAGAADALQLEPAMPAGPEPRPVEATPKPPADDPHLVEERASASLIAPYRPPSTRVGRYALAGIAGVVVVVAGLWLARRAPEGDNGAGVPAGAATAAPTATAPPTTSQAPPAPPPVEAQQRESAPPAAGVPHASPALPGPAPNVSTPPPAEDAFDLVVASFHTIGRANEVAAAVKSAGEPVRVRAAAGWQQVIAGPYQSRSTGEQAQQRLARAGLTGTRLVSAAR